MLLSCAVKLLHFANDDITLVNMAREWLEVYVETFSLYHGITNLTYNVHNLLHLAECVEQFGNISTFSMYKYENAMQEIKKYIKKPTQILQHRNNCIERGRFGLSEKQVYKVKKSHGLNNFNLDLTQKNNHVLLQNGQVVEIVGFSDNSGQTMIHGKVYCDKKLFFEEPCNSEEILSITVVKRKSEDIIVFSEEYIESKLFRLPYENGFVVQPLLHMT
jgi:hypothetical protein